MSLPRQWLGLPLTSLVGLVVALVAALVVSGPWGLVAAVLAAEAVVLLARGSDAVAVSGTAAAPELVALVERLRTAAGVPPMRVVVTDTGVPNAFATGGLRHTPAISVDRATLGLLEDDELEAVLAHEVAHVAARDAAVVTLAAAGAVLAAVGLRLGVQEGLLGGRAALLALPVLLGAGLVALRAYGRCLELAADRAAVALTGRPEALARALEAVDRAVARSSVQSPAAVLAFGPPARRPLSRLWATHPTTARRIAVLQQARP